MISLQEQISELQAKVNILREANKTLASFRKHFHKITRSKCELENVLIKYQKRSSDHSQSGMNYFFLRKLQNAFILLKGNTKNNS